MLVTSAALFAGLAAGVGGLSLAAWAVTGPLGVLKAGFEILGIESISLTLANWRTKLYDSSEAHSSPWAR